MSENRIEQLERERDEAQYLLAQYRSDAIDFKRERDEARAELAKANQLAIDQGCDGATLAENVQQLIDQRDGAKYRLGLVEANAASLRAALEEISKMGQAAPMVLLSLPSAQQYGQWIQGEIARAALAATPAEALVARDRRIIGDVIRDYREQWVEFKAALDLIRDEAGRERAALELRQIAEWCLAAAARVPGFDPSDSAERAGLKRARAQLLSRADDLAQEGRTNGR